MSGVGDPGRLRQQAEEYAQRVVTPLYVGSETPTTYELMMLQAVARHFLAGCTAALVAQAETALETIGARQQLAYWWYEQGRCPCGARRESPATHNHVIGCPTERALRQGVTGDRPAAVQMTRCTCPGPEWAYQDHEPGCPRAALAAQAETLAALEQEIRAFVGVYRNAKEFGIEQWADTLATLRASRPAPQETE